MAERRKYLDNWPLNLDMVSVGRRHAEALWQAAHVVDFLASAFLASENLFCRQMSGEEDSVGASGVFSAAHQSYRARHSGGRNNRWDHSDGGKKEKKKENAVSASFSKCGCGRGKVAMGRVFWNFDVLSLTCVTGLGTN